MLFELLFLDFLKLFNVDNDLFEWKDERVDDENTDDSDKKGFEDLRKLFRSSLITRLISGILVSKDRFKFDVKSNFSPNVSFLFVTKCKLELLLFGD